MRTSNYYIKLAYLLGKEAGFADFARSAGNKIKNFLGRGTPAPIERAMPAALSPKQRYNQNMQTLSRQMGSRAAVRDAINPQSMRTPTNLYKTRAFNSGEQLENIPGYGIAQRWGDRQTRIRRLQDTAELRGMGALGPEGLPANKPLGAKWLSQDKFRQMMLA